MKLGISVEQNAHGMFGSSDNEIVISSGSSSESESEDEVRSVAKVKAHKPKKVVEESEEDEIRPVATRKARKPKKPAEESAEEEIARPARERRRKRRRNSTPVEQDGNEDQEEHANDEEDDLREDLAFLRSSPPPDRGRLRSTHEKPKTAREKALEALKRKRGNTNEPSSSAATPGRKKPVIIESDSESDLEVIQEDQDDNTDDQEQEDEEKEDEHETNAFDVFQENVDDENFIDDDDEGLIGTPAEAARLPLQFSGLSSAKPRELFKYAIEWMVQRKINPAFSSDDEIYTLAFRKLDDEVSGLATSKFHSSVWTADFTRAIRARPEITINDIGHLGMIIEPHCEACNRKNHVAKWEVVLTGHPYDKETLEPLGGDSDSDSDDSSSSSALSSRGLSPALNGEKPAYDASGERLPPESRRFTLGSTCKANAQVAHTLYHWRYHLNSWVVDYLVRQGHCTPEKLVKRDKWSVKKREKYANKVVDQMEREGEIRKLHRLYKEQVDFALEAQNEYKKGWGRRG